MRIRNRKMAIMKQVQYNQSDHGAQTPQEVFILKRNE